MIIAFRLMSTPPLGRCPGNVVGDKLALSALETGIVLAVTHDVFRATGLVKPRGYDQEYSMFFDIKSVFACEDSL